MEKGKLLTWKENGQGKWRMSEECYMSTEYAETLFFSQFPHICIYIVLDIKTIARKRYAQQNNIKIVNS